MINETEREFLIYLIPFAFLDILSPYPQISLGIWCRLSENKLTLSTVSFPQGPMAKNKSPTFKFMSKAKAEFVPSHFP